VRVGILGGGQLSRLLALAGMPLGLQFSFYDPSAEACVLTLGDRTQAGYADGPAIARWADKVDVITFENENIPLDMLQFLATRKATYPQPEALRISQDRWLEKNLFSDLQSPLYPFFNIQSQKDIKQAAVDLGFPFVLKKRKNGFNLVLIQNG
jgi:5-(carboxyamino)imidazole ribonucleotide synthase